MGKVKHGQKSSKGKLNLDGMKLECSPVYRNRELTIRLSHSSVEGSVEYKGMRGNWHRFVNSKIDYKISGDLVGLVVGYWYIIYYT